MAAAARYRRVEAEVDASTAPRGSDVRRRRRGRAPSWTAKTLIAETGSPWRPRPGRGGGLPLSYSPDWITPFPRLAAKTVAVASAGPRDGKTTTVLNLALAAKREGREVLLVDGDERTRRLSQMCRDGGYFDVVKVSQNGDEYRPPTPRPRPKTATCGKVLQIGPEERNGQHPAEFFRSKAFRKMLSFSGEPDDLVLTDTPALLDVSEAVTIADQLMPFSWLSTWAPRSPLCGAPANGLPSPTPR